MTNIFPDGSGVFETIKTIGGNPLFLNEHLARARSGAEKLGYPMDAEDVLRKIISEELLRSAVTTHFGRLRLCFYEDSSISISHSEYEKWTRPARVTLSDWIVDETSLTCNIKSLPFAMNLDALREAKLRDFDEIIRFNRRGEVCEGATANLFAKIGGAWFTPNLASGCLPGIIRGFLLSTLPVSERSISRDELPEIESFFLVSSLRELQPVSHIDQIELIIDDVFREKAEQELARVR
jgi:branched-subunit amino acid aminotransferase/4-amino-4-deoxychorismate lyase